MPVASARAALELVADPWVSVDEHNAQDLLRWCWDLVGEAYGVSRQDPFWAVHRAGSPRNCLTLCTTEACAQEVVRWWPGGSVTITPVAPGARDAEHYIALAVALHWRRPPSEKKSDSP